MKKYKRCNDVRLYPVLDADYETRKTLSHIFYWLSPIVDGMVLGPFGASGPLGLINNPFNAMFSIRRERSEKTQKI